jgi:hypothetical protein
MRITPANRTVECSEDRAARQRATSPEFSAFKA